MSLPFLLLGLYLALLVLAVALCSWAGHSAPPTEEARRVTDAAERAGLGQLAAPFRLAGTVALLFSVLIATLAIFTGLPTKWFLVAPLVAPLLIAGALFYCARKALRTTGQLVGMAGADAKLILTGRSVLGIVLCCESALGLVILGTSALCSAELSVEQARFLIYLVGSAIALFVVVFARATTSVEFTSYGGTTAAPDGPHPGSLALLVAATFHAPLVKLAALIVLSTLGHCALLSIDGLPGQEEKLWLYPHLLKLLGLFGLLFAGLVVRTSEEESGSEGWVRGAVVYLILMVAGAWSLSSQLPENWTRSVPAGLSFFYVSLGLSLWMSGGTARRNSGISEAALVPTGAARGEGAAEERTSIGYHALLSLPSLLLYFGLLCVLILSTSPASESALPAKGELALIHLPASTLTSLLLSGALSALPLAFTWVVARTLSSGSREAEMLAFVGTRHGLPARAPSQRLVVALPMLASVIVLAALSAGWSGATTMNGVAFTLFGTGAIVGGLTLAGLVGHVERSCRAASREIASLLRDQVAETERLPAGESAPVNFEAAVLYCRETTGKSGISWLFLCLTPCWAAAATLFLIPTQLFQSLTLGLGTGAALLGIGILLLPETDSNNDRRPLAHLAFVSAVAQGLWLLAAGSFPA